MYGDDILVGFDWRHNIWVLLWKNGCFDQAITLKVEWMSLFVCIDIEWNGSSDTLCYLLYLDPKMFLLYTVEPQYNQTDVGFYVLSIF